MCQYLRPSSNAFFISFGDNPDEYASLVLEESQPNSYRSLALWHAGYHQPQLCFRQNELW
jgi:hypothetical protein